MEFNKNLLFENLVKIKKCNPIFEKLIGQIYFNKSTGFDIENINNLKNIHRILLEKAENYEFIESNEGLVVPIFKTSKKKIHSIYNPLRERIKIEEINDNKVCVEIVGIGFLYSLYDIKTRSSKSFLYEKNFFDQNFSIGKFFNYINSKNIIFILIDETLDLLLLSCFFFEVYKIFENNHIFFYIKGLNKNFDIYQLLFFDYLTILNPIYVEKIIRKEYPNCFLNVDKIQDIVLEWESIRKDVLFNLKTTSINLTLGLKNLFSNIISISKNKDLMAKVLNNTNLLEIFDNKNYLKENAIIIGASPTLDSYETKKDLFEKLKIKNIFVVAVDNAINYCLANNILPDLIVILDHRSIINLMFNKINKEYKKIPILMPLTISNKMLFKFDNPYIFNLDIFKYSINLAESLFFNILNDKGKLSDAELDLKNKINNIKKIYYNIPIIDIPVKNIGAFSYILLRYFNYKNIFTFGIDFSFLEKKYYYSSSYFYDILNQKQSYLQTTQSFSVKRCIKSGEKYLFEQYINEWEKIGYKNIDISFYKDIYDKSFIDYQVENILNNIIAFYYFRNKDKIELQNNLIIFFMNMQKILLS